LTEELQLEEGREGLEATAAKSGVQFFEFRDWIIKIENDIRVHLELPFSRSLTDELRKILTVFVEHIAEDLAAAPGTLQRPVTAPNKLKNLQRDGEEILADLGPYAELADHYFDEKVKNERLRRPTNEVAAEIDTITERAKALWRRIVKYLNDLKGAIAESYGHDDALD
jgi:hypothetical protein